MKLKKIIVAILILLLGGFGTLMGFVGMFAFITIYMRSGEPGTIEELFLSIGIFALAPLSLWGVRILWRKFFAV